MAGQRAALAGTTLLLLSAAAAAGGEWQSVTLDGGVGMDVPAIVHDGYKTTPDDIQKGAIAFFGVTGEEFGDLYCMLSRNDYTPQVTRELVIARLSSKDRDVLCRTGEGRTEIEVGESESLTSSGHPAAHCAASYTVASDKLPGHVNSVFAIAAPGAFYQFSCTLDAESQSKATAHWVSIWSEDVKHMEKSIQLPPE